MQEMVQTTVTVGAHVFTKAISVLVSLQKAQNSSAQKSPIPPSETPK